MNQAPKHPTHASFSALKEADEQQAAAPTARLDPKMTRINASGPGMLSRKMTRGAHNVHVMA